MSIKMEFEAQNRAQVYKTSINPEELLTALQSFRDGDFSVNLSKELPGIDGEIATAFNELVYTASSIESEFVKVGLEVGKRGDWTSRANLSFARGSWKSCMDSYNTVLTDLTNPSLELMRIINAVADGDLSSMHEPPFDSHSLEGEYLRMAQETQRMLENLNSLTEEVTRVIRDVGIEGNNPPILISFLLFYKVNLVDKLVILVLKELGRTLLMI
jgi:hypothetical protein